MIATAVYLSIRIVREMEVLPAVCEHGGRCQSYVASDKQQKLIKSSELVHPHMWGYFRSVGS